MKAVAPASRIAIARPADRPTVAGLAPALGLTAILLIASLFGHQLPDRAAGTVAAVFPPGQDAETSLAAIVGTDARLVRTGRTDWIWIVHRDVPGLAADLRAAGAILVLDPESALGCLFSVAARPDGDPPGRVPAVA